MRAVGRDYEYPGEVRYEELDEVIGVEKMLQDDFEKWRKDLVDSMKSGDWVHANILLDEMQASIT